MGRKLVVGCSIAVAAIVGAVAIGQVSSRRARAAYPPVEQQFAARGSWAVAHSTFTDPASGFTYELTQPADLGANGFEHPVVTWGNGSWAVPSQYTGVLDQLASWGFVVIASTSSQTGTGNEILAGAQAMVAANANPASAYFGKLDTAHIGAVGHSQGAGGSVRATVNSGGLITTTVPIALPAQIWVSKPGDAFDVAQLTDPVFFLGGSLDLLICGPLTVTGYYDRVPGAAAAAVLRGADHNTIQNTGGRFLGYLTAWLMFQLRGDTTAAQAFTGPSPELLTNTAWSWQRVKGL